MYPVVRDFAQIDMQEFTMTSFVHVDISKRHAGAERLEAAATAAGQLRHQASGTRGLATLLLSAIAAAVMVAAYQVMDSVAEGHLLVIWIAMWAAAFASLALFAGSARNLAARMKAAADTWSRSIAEAKSDQRLWAAAQKDARVMSDLQAAMTRGGQDFDEVSHSGKAGEFNATKNASFSLPQVTAVAAALATAQVTALRPYQQLYI